MVEQRHVREEMPQVAYQVLHPAITHGVALSRVEIAFHHVGSTAGTEMRITASLYPVGLLCTIADEAIGSNIDRRTVEGVNRLVNMIDNGGAMGKSQDIPLVALAYTNARALYYLVVRPANGGDGM